MAPQEHITFKYESGVLYPKAFLWCLGWDLLVQSEQKVVIWLLSLHFRVLPAHTHTHTHTHTLHTHSLFQYFFKITEIT